MDKILELNQKIEETGALISELEKEKIDYLINQIDYKGKYLKIREDSIDYFYYRYMYVEDVLIDGATATFKGRGFSYSYENNLYDKFFCWGEFTTKKVYISNENHLKTLKNNIEIITKEELLSEAKKAIDLIYHNILKSEEK